MKNKKQDKQLEKLLFEVYDKGVKQQDCNLTEYIEKTKQALRIHNVSGKQSPNKITDNEHKDLIKVLYQKDKSKTFRLNFNLPKTHSLNIVDVIDLYSFEDREPEQGAYISLVWEDGSDYECIYAGLNKKSISPLPTHWYYVK